MEPSLWEQFFCWTSEAGTVCQNARQDRRDLERHELTQQMIDAQAQEAAAQAARAAMLEQLTTVALVTIPPTLLVVGGIGGYLWWRRGKREEEALEAEIAMSLLEE